MGEAPTEPPQRSIVKHAQITGLAITLIVAGAYVSVPIPGSPLPLVLQNMFVVFTGLLLSPLWAGSAVTLYLAMGALGLPILARGTGGVAYFAGPTGGYLAGYLIAAPLVALIVAAGNRSQPHAVAAHTARLSVQITAVSAGMLVIYIPGVLWLAYKLQTDIGATLLSGFVPFIIGDLLKVAALIAILRGLPIWVWRALS